jgi:hypothetical protein
MALSWLNSIEPATGDCTAVGQDDCSSSAACCVAFLRLSGTLLLCARLNHRFSALHWQVNQTAALLTAGAAGLFADGRLSHHSWRRTVALFIAQRVIESRQRRRIT